jgi:hypothetical protein
MVYGMRESASKFDPVNRNWRLRRGVFSVIGLIVLFALCTLICVAWYLVLDIVRFETPGAMFGSRAPVRIPPV